MGNIHFPIGACHWFLFNYFFLLSKMLWNANDIIAIIAIYQFIQFILFFVCFFFPWSFLMCAQNMVFFWFCGAIFSLNSQFLMNFFLFLFFAQLQPWWRGLDCDSVCSNFGQPSFGAQQFFKFDKCVNIKVSIVVVGRHHHHKPSRIFNL